MADFGGEFVVPSTVYVPGSIVVGAWKNVLVTVDTIPLDSPMELSCTANINFGAGKATITAGDAERLQYESLLEGKEVEIFLKKPDINIANKVWGGYLESTKWAENKKNVLTLTVKEYSSRLLQQKLGAALSWAGTDLQTVLQNILAKQTDLTYDAITAMGITGKAIYMDFTADTIIYDAIRKVCEQNDYYFGVSVNRDCYARKKTDVFLSADTLVAGENVMSQNEIETNKEFQLTTVDVKSKTSGGTVYAGTATSTEPALTQSRTVYVSDLTSNAAAAAYAQTLIDTNESPLFTAKVPSALLMYTQPTYSLPCNIPKKGIVGNYIVVEISHTWSQDKGICSTTILSNKIIDTTIELGFISRRVNTLESKTFA